MAEKKDLCKLSQCLGRATKLLNTVLEQPESRNSNQCASCEHVPTVPLSVQNEQRQQECDNNTSPHIKNVNRLSSCEASTSQNASAVSSAINRARLMIQQSSSKGLYS